MDRIFHIFVIVLIQTYTAGAKEWCDFGDSRKYCDHGCCGDVCCTIEIWLIFAIIGSVFGGILLISFAICLFCVLMKQKVKPGRVIHPAPGDQVFSTSSPNIYPMYPQAHGVYPSTHGFYPQQPGYFQAPTVPLPAYTTCDENLNGQHPAPQPSGIA